MTGEATPIPTTTLFSISADLFTEVQRIIANSQVRSLKLKLGDRTLKELPVAPLTAIATILLVALAVIITNLSIEVEQAPNTTVVNEASH